MEKSTKESNDDGTARKSSSQKLKDLAQRLYCPEPRVDQVETSIESSLSHIPWTVELDEGNSGSMPASNTGTPSQSVPEVDSKLAPAASSLPISYLELRRQQNIAFADKKAAEATEAGLLQHAQAEALFKQALNLVADHVPSLVGYGKLLIKMGRLKQAQRYLEEALEVEPNHKTALLYKKSIEQTFRQKPRNSLTSNDGSLLSSGKKRRDLQMRESSAFQDALLERNLAMEGGAAVENDGHVVTETGNRDDDSDSYDSDEEDRRRRKRRRHKKDRKRKKKKKKRKHKRRYDSSSSESEGSASAS